MNGTTFRRARGAWCGLALAATCATAGAMEPQSPPGPAGLPYVYTQWQRFTRHDGLPDDHVFAVAVQGSKVWAGTENGLALLDKETGRIRSWGEADGLPWRVVSALAVDERTGDLWVGLFGGGLARFSGGRFEHWHQLNSGLVNDVVYGLTLENDNVWVATTAGASRFDTRSGQWTIFTEKNAPMEEIWNYGATYDAGKVYLAVWGSGILEFDVATERWKDYLDPDGEMEIDLYRDDGIVHVITTGVSHVDGTLWAGSYFGASRYDGRHWRGFYSHECGLPSDFTNAVRARSATEAWFATDKGLGVLADFESNTWVAYSLGDGGKSGRAIVKRDTEVLEVVETGPNLAHDYVLWIALDGNDAWIATAKGLSRARGPDYYPGLRERPAAGVAGPTALRSEP